MDWWILEIIVLAVLSVIALLLGPFIKRFGRSYAADVFRSNPSTGKSFIVLTDVAYYLIFAAYILFTTTIERPTSSTASMATRRSRPTCTSTRRCTSAFRSICSPS